MAKYLIILLFGLIVIASIFIFFQKNANVGKNQPTLTPKPVITAPSNPPAPSSSTLLPSISPSMSTQDQLKLQQQADKDFADTSKQINDTYPWLNKLPLQSQNYYVYFDVQQKEFIGKLYPSSSSSVSVDQQVATMQSEIKTKLQDLIPDYTKYNISWDIKPE